MVIEKPRVQDSGPSLYAVLEGNQSRAQIVAGAFRALSGW
jgi:hypothetical protein